MPKAKFLYQWRRRMLRDMVLQARRKFFLNDKQKSLPRHCQAEERRSKEHQTSVTVQRWCDPGQILPTTVLPVSWGFPVLVYSAAAGISSFLGQFSLVDPSSLIDQSLLNHNFSSFLSKSPSFTEMIPHILYPMSFLYVSERTAEVTNMTRM